MRLHPKEQPINRATTGLALRIHEYLDEQLDEFEDLTFAEVVRIVHGAHDIVLSGMIKTEIRRERHPDDPDHPGGLE